MTYPLPYDVMWFCVPLSWPTTRATTSSDRCGSTDTESCLFSATLLILLCPSLCVLRPWIRWIREGMMPSRHLTVHAAMVAPGMQVANMIRFTVCHLCR